MALTLTSPAFASNGAIPREHTCDDADVAPTLVWSGTPAGTKSFVLIVDDPDAPDPKAPKMTYVHWVLYDIPPSEKGIPRGGRTPVGARDGRNDWKKPGYGGPCPPIGRHRYFFKLYALDTVLGDLSFPGKDQVVAAMQGHILGQAELIGTYERSK
ncbi:MAG: YbhB/YbcL family Raf kinase inhibitor-like protein [Gemmatimonadaceae bacterium]